MILVSPCPEGLSRTHGDEIRRFGYRSLAEIRKLVESGRIRHKVVGVHMHQVSTVAVEKAKLILVSSGIGENEARAVGLGWAASADEAFARALSRFRGQSPRIAVLRGASRILPLHS